jgi:hypothetical protein
MAVRLPALCTGHALPHRNIIFLLLLLISVRVSKPQGLVRPEGLGKFKTFIYIIGCRIDDLLAFSIVPQPLRYCMP